MSGKTRKQQIEEMLAEEPNDPFLLYELAMEYVSQGDDEQAVRCFRDLIAVDATYVPAFMQAGQALVRLNQAAEARAVWAQGIGAARHKGDQHAAEEMSAMLAGLE